MSTRESIGQETIHSVPKSAKNDNGIGLVVTGVRTVSQGSSVQGSLRADQLDTISSTTPSDEPHVASWSKKYILTLGEFPNSDLITSANSGFKMVEVFGATLLF
jgi:hypothetical protein